MRDREYPSDLIIRRGAFIWARALHAPNFDNGDNSLVGAFGQGLANTNAAFAATKAGDIPARIAAFERELVAHLIHVRENDGEPMNDADADWYRATMRNDKEAPTYWWSASLSTDYNPDAALTYAADKAGLPRNMFSWKSRVWLHNGFASSSFGYGAGDMYHYPLSDGRWLITDLRAGSGDDIEKLKAAVIEGRIDLRIEPAMPELNGPATAHRD